MTSKGLTLENKVAMITGSTSGIGRGIALRFAEEGAAIVLNYPESELLEDARQTVHELNELGAEAISVKADVGKPEESDRLIKDTLEKFGKIDILVNNAGVCLEKPIIETKVEEWDRILDINLRGVFLCSKAVIPHMLKQGKGRIINIASTDAFVAETGLSAYCASKGGVAALTAQLAVELGPNNITVNAIAPGIIESRMSSWLQTDQAAKNRVVARTPVRRIGKPSDIAEAALFFAKDGTEFVTGTVLFVDGGWMAVGYPEITPGIIERSPLVS